MIDPVLEQALAPDASALARQVGRIERYLTAALDESTKGSPLEGALKNAVLGPGKRLRPLLTLSAYNYATTEAAGPAEPSDSLLAVACAFELLHAASLIYDDLPCMDNDTLRRGRPALHVAHGEDTALLAAGSLKHMAYKWVKRASPLAAETRLDIIELMADTMGARGLAAGQWYDLHGNPPETRHLKTGILFRAAAEAGARCANASPAVHEEVACYANRLGTAFQLLDDLADHDAPEDEARLKADMQRLLAEGIGSLRPQRAVPLRDYTALVFGMAPRLSPR